jgi:hypothetical protein
VTEVLELAVAAANAADDDDKCPFCTDKALGACPAKKQEPVKEVVSKPDQLACGRLSPQASCPHSYTTAQHHLISAKQCYAKIKPCVRMGSMAGYDINDPPNGIALPTVANNLLYTVGDSTEQKYGKLSDAEKQEVAFAVMGSEKAQWHVGHHAVTVELLEHWSDEEEDAPWRRGHYVSYDTEVIAQLLKILSKYQPTEECDEKKPDKFKSDMDELSGNIKGKLNEFKGLDPSGSSPFFVSQLAATYAKSRDTKPKPAPKPSR